MLRVSGGGRFTQYHRRFLFGSVADHLAATLGTKGSPISLSTACASGASAIQLGVEAIRRGEADAALCVATDGSVNPETLVRFSLLSALSTQNVPPRPPRGRSRKTAMASSWRRARTWFLRAWKPDHARGATILGVVAGCGELANSFHRTRSTPTASRSSDAFGTHFPTRVWNPIRSITSTPTAPGRPRTTRWSILAFPSFRVSAPGKSRYPRTNRSSGTPYSAAGAVEAVFSLLTLEHRAHPADRIDCDLPDPAIPFDVVPNKARDARVTTVMSNSFGFGGQCLADPDPRAGLVPAFRSPVPIGPGEIVVGP